METFVTLPRGVPVTDEALERRLRTLGKAQRASEDEVEGNPRARSAVMRIQSFRERVEARRRRFFVTNAKGDRHFLYVVERTTHLRSEADGCDHWA